MGRYATIDVGTNTVRLLVADADTDGTYRVVFEEQVITRLGERLQETGALSPAAVERTIRVLQRFAQRAKEHRVQEVLAVTTSAAREARNRAEFLDRARREAGIDLVVISGEVEATLTALGVAHALGPDHATMLIVDIGGGSTEFTAFEQGRVTGYVSLPIGVVKLTEAYLKSDPPSREELESAATSIRQTILQVPASLSIPTAAILVATAGTPTTLAAIDLRMTTYDGERVTGHRLSRQRIQELLDHLCSLPLAERQKIIGLEPPRADVIVAGTLLTREILDVFGFDDFTVSDGGLREGLLLHHLAHRHRGSQSDSPPSPERGGISQQKT
ncbi:MAG: Ppx/GppA family phosphatase [Candidatus Methylomirabilales bacterium]